MRNIRLSVLTFLLGFVAVLAGCSSPEKMLDEAAKVAPQMSPNPLVLRGTKVEGKVTGTFPPKFFHKKAKLDASPIMTYGGKELLLKTWSYQGEDITENNPVINFEAGGAFGGDFSFVYSPEMMDAKVELRLTLHHKEESLQFPIAYPLGLAVDVTQTLVETAAQPALMPHNYVKARTETKEAQFNFAIQQPDIRRGELTKEEVKAFQKAIAELKGNDKAQLTDVSVSAYASPDGPVDLNDRLSKGRGTNTEKWVAKALSGSKLDKELVKIAEQSTDWDGFKKLVEESEIEDKDMILRVLSMYSDPDTRNKEMHNMGKVFSEVAETILPKLRRAKMVASIEVLNRTDEEIKALIEQKKVAELSLVEGLYGATLFDDLAIQEEVYTELAKTNNEIRVHNNLAVVYLKQGNIEGAKASLASASEINDQDPYVLNNLGVIEMREGRFEEAKKLFLRATDAGKPVKENLGAISIQEGDYAAASEYLSGTNSFNEGLALLLQEKNDASKTIFTELKTANSYYALAILGVRAKDEKMVLDNMRTAISMEGKWKERAQKDVVFASYRQNEAFANLLK